MGRILAIDYGRKRTGLAVTDTLRITANPLLTIETKELINWLTDYFAKEPVDEVVIGHPTQLNGEDSESMNYIRPFMGVFKKSLPFFEKAHEMAPEERSYIQTLKGLYYRFGMDDKEQEMKTLLDTL